MSEPRHRQYGPYDTGAIVTKYYNNAVYDTYGYRASRVFNESDDIVTKDFRRLVASGAIVNNPCKMVFTTESTGNGSYHATKSATGERYDVNNGSITSYQAHLKGPGNGIAKVTINYDSLIKEAKLNCLANIDSGDYHFGEDIAEIGETIKYLRNPARSIFQLAESAARSASSARKKLKKAADVAKATNDIYLSYRFAATPLLRSSLDAIEAYNRSVPTKKIFPERLTARGFASDTAEAHADPKANWSASIYDVFHSSVKETARVKATILYTNPRSSGAMFRLGLRPSDIPVTLWAIVPLSFMVDRVLDISGSIQGAVNMLNHGRSLLAGSVVVRKEYTRTLQFTQQVNPGWSVTVIGDTITEHVFSYERTVWQPRVSDLVPPLVLGNLVKDATSIADLFSLTASRLSTLHSTKR